jgi:hypothetical protein
MAVRNPFGDRRNHPSVDLWIEVPQHEAQAAKSREDFHLLLAREARRRGKGSDKIVIGFRYPDHLIPLPADGSSTDTESGRVALAAVGVTAFGAPPLRSTEESEGPVERRCYQEETRSRRRILRQAARAGAVVAGIAMLGFKREGAVAQQSYCSCSVRCRSTMRRCPSGCGVYRNFFYYNELNQCDVYCYSIDSCLSNVCQSYSSPPYCRG